MLTALLLVSVMVLGVLVALQANRIRQVEESLRRLHEEQFRRRLGEEPEFPLRAQPVPRPGPVPMPQPAAVPPPLPVAGPAMAAAAIPRGPVPVGRAAGPLPAAPVPTAAPVAEIVAEPVVPMTPPAPLPAPRVIDWERFLGVKLFAWLGGLALFIAAGFFLKYSFDHDLIPPALRVAIGYLAATGLVVGGLRLWRRQYETLAATLAATGIVILYAVTFACRALYHFPAFGVVPTFLMMALITAAAFVLAVRKDAQVVAVLGLLGGFLTPVLVNSGQDNPLGLFGYVVILDVGLFAVVRHRRWDVLALLAAVATVATQAAWNARFFTAEKLGVVQVVEPLFVALFAGMFCVMERAGRGSRWTTAAMAIPAGFVLLHGLALAASGSGTHPVRLFTTWLLVDAVLLATLVRARRPAWLEPAGGAGVFLLLAAWTTGHADATNLNASLAAYLAFALFHTALPVVRLRQEDGRRPAGWGQFFPAAALLLFLLPLVRDTGVLPAAYWVAVLAVDVMALLLAAMLGAFLAAGAVLVVSFVVLAAALLRTGGVAIGFQDSLVLVAGFAALFVAGGWWLARRGMPRGWGLPGLVVPPGAARFVEDPRLAICGTGAVLPFLLLAMMATRATPAELHPLFGMTALLSVLVLGLARSTGFHLLGAFALAGTALVEATWFARRFGDDGLHGVLGWHAGLLALFTAFPFAVDGIRPRRAAPWILAACAAPVQFLAFYATLRATGPLPAAGLVPAAFAVPALAVLALLASRWPADDRRRLAVLSVQGGVALLFVTAVFPVQLSRQWLTLAWCVEGAALLWLFRRLPHPGLRLAGIALLTAGFARLALNPAVLAYHAREGMRIWNWYLYAYLVAAAAQFAGAALLRPPAHLLFRKDVRPVLRAFGVALLFALLNIEIADSFAEGATLTFDFTGNLARDLSYTIGWSLFALCLLVAGIVRASRATRYTGLALLGITLVKLFLHDLARLDQLYRIGAFAGVAVVAMAASFLYQRFLNKPQPAHENPAP